MPHTLISEGKRGTLDNCNSMLNKWTSYVIIDLETVSQRK
jgi:hypothetical protein